MMFTSTRGEYLKFDLNKSKGEYEVCPIIFIAFYD